MRRFVILSCIKEAGMDLREACPAWTVFSQDFDNLPHGVDSSGQPVAEDEHGHRRGAILVFW